MVQSSNSPESARVELPKHRFSETSFEQSPDFRHQAALARTNLSVHADDLRRQAAGSGSLTHLAVYGPERAGTVPVGGDSQRQAFAVVRDAEHPVKAITVVYQNQGEQPPGYNPDFRIMKDGTVQASANAGYRNNDNIVIEVARDPGDRGEPTPAQKQAIDKLVSDLANKYMTHEQRPDGAPALDGRINDDQGLVSLRVRQTLGAQRTALDELPPETRQQIQNTNRWSGAGVGPHGHGRFTNEEAGRQFAPRYVPRQVRSDHETVALAAMKDIVSGFITRNERDPYHAVKHWGPEGHRVGRYGTSAAQYRSWLAGLSEAQIKELIAEGKLSSGALQLFQFLKEHPDGSDPNGQLQGDAKALNDFLNKLQKGDDNDKPTQQEIDRFFNKHLQEKMGSDLIRQYAQQTADRDEKGGLMANIGKIALSMYLGRPASEEDSKDPRYQAFMDAALKAWPLAVQKEQGANGIDLSDKARSIAALARANEGRALWAGSGTGANLGCASSVCALLRQAGFRIPQNNTVCGLARQLAHSGWRVDTFDHRRPGDVVVCVSGPSGHGHIGVMGEGDITYSNSSCSGRWSHANAQSYWMRRSGGGRYGLYVLHPPGSATA